MKVSLDWLRDFVDLPDDPQQIADVLTGLGLEVEGTARWERIPGGLEGVVVGHVLTCGRHPGADRLSLTTVDVGGPEPVQIVCGAPNVAAGQYVPVATVGTVLYPEGPDGKPLKLKRGKIRGEVSQGMICAEDELGIGESHDGILVLDGEPAPGTPARQLFGLAEDVVYEIGLTPNRSDATSHRGVAADLRAYFVTHRGYAQPLREARGLNAASVETPDDPEPFTVEVLDGARAPRYAGVVLEGITVGPSPQWLVDRLAAVGVRSINNVVDATNYVLHGIGQPLHAFDLDRVGGGGIRVRTLAQNTPFTTLDGKERTLDAEDLVICDAEDRPMCLAGVFGGQHSGVGDATTRIFLESACFEPRTTRRSAARHLLFTDAARAFEKGVDPTATVDALARAVGLLAEVAGARVASELVDIVSGTASRARVRLDYRRLRRLAGVDIEPERVRTILEALNFEIASADERGLTVDVPADRADVLREADVVEEVLRVYGYDAVPVPSQIRFSPAIAPSPGAHDLRRRVAGYLLGRGLHEGMGLSLVPSRVYESLAPELAGRLVKIHNTSTVELDALRVSLLPTGLQAIAYNEARQQLDLRFFEFGRGYLLDGGSEAQRAPAPLEREQLAIWATGARGAEHWTDPDPAGVDFAYVRGLAEGALASVGVGADEERALAADGADGADSTGLPAAALAYGQQLLVAGETAATIGRVAPAWLEYFDTKSTEVYVALLHWPAVAAAARRSAAVHTATPVSRYPQVRRDLAVVVDESVTFGELAEVTRGPAGKFAASVSLFDVFEDAERLGAGRRSYALRFVFERPDRTLKDSEVDRAMSAVAQAVGEHPGMEIRR